MALLFGTAGTPHSSHSPTTQAGIERIRELGLDCMEIQFVQGVKMGERTALQAAEVARSLGVRLSCHAPYFINLNAHEPEKLSASEARILQSARIGALCGAESVVAHTAFYLGDPPQTVYQRVKGSLEKIVATLRREGNPILIRPEVMGRDTQFGNLEEVLSLSAEIEGVLPTLDFSHWHARHGKNNTYDEFLLILKQVESRLGRRGLEKLHIHLSGIEYSQAGERKHLNLKEADLRYEELLRALKDSKASGTIICESPNLEEDALLLQQTYRSLP
ncbi:MAG: TIM barrel protein [Chloroflexi bacterium]|nr:TIM barrel protein [Chloroflexota bacterium]